MPVEISRLDDEYIKIPARAIVDGDIVDPTSYSAHIAFILGGGRPASGDYGVATWETDATAPITYKLKRKATTLRPGSYGIWVKIDTGAELVQRLVDTLTVV